MSILLRLLFVLLGVQLIACAALYSIIFVAQLQARAECESAGGKYTGYCSSTEAQKAFSKKK